MEMLLIHTAATKLRPARRVGDCEAGDFMLNVWPLEQFVLLQVVR